MCLTKTINSLKSILQRMKHLSLVFAMMLLCFSMAMAQRTITGIVTDESGEALPFANVFVEGTTVGTTTDIDGNYSLKVPEGATTIVISYTGYNDQNLAIGDSNTMNCTMAEGEILDEVVVTAVGLEANRRSLGYAVQNVDSEEILASKEVNLVNALSSKVAGVTVVSSSGSPGASANIRVRGSTSINGSNSPLFVIDGIPIDNSSNGNDVDGVDQSNRAIDINPNDIEDMTVLKGAAATALYGVRAANGAIIITTKKGAAGKPSVTFSTSYSADQYNKLPARQSLYAQGRPGADLDGDGLGDPNYRGPETAEGFSWGPAISSLEFDGDGEYAFNQNGRLVPAGTGNGQAAQAYDPYTFFKTGNTYDLNLSVQGGSEKVNYYISAGRLGSTGIVPNADFQRNSFRLTTNANITDRLDVGFSANYINSGGSRIQRGSNLQGVMLGLLRTTPTFDNGNGLEGQAGADAVGTYELPNGAQRSYRSGVYDNPYWTVNKNPFGDAVNRLIGYASLGYEFTDWLKLSYKLGTDLFTDRRLGAFDINPGRSSGGVYQSFRESRDLNSDLLLTFNQSLTDKLGLSVTVGQNIFDTRVADQFSAGTTLSIPNFYNISNASDITSGDDFAQKRIFAVFGTADFSYDEYLFLNLTARNDWSSSLPVDNNDFLSYSASLGFAFSELLDLPSNSLLQYGKLRASYGKVGNDAPIYATSNYFNQAFSGGDGFITGISFPAYGVNAFEQSSILGNANITPETTTSYEVGAEFKFLKDRLGFDITYFNSESKDQIIEVQLPASTGYTDFVQNAGLITSKGLELVAYGTPLKMANDKFRWDINMNFTKIVNTVDSLAPGIEEIGLAGFTSTSSRVVAGQPYGAIFGSGFQKDDAGNTIIGADGWPLQDPETGVYGDPNPDWTMGIRNTFTILEGIRLSALLDIRQGGDMWCGTCGVMNYFGTTEETGERRNDVVVFEGVTEDGAPNNVPVALADPDGGLGANYWVRYAFGGLTEQNIYDTSWIRLREVSIGYDVPKTMLQSIPFERLSLTLTGRNLWLNTSYPGIDPETNLTGSSNGIGLDYFNMPNTKSYNVSLRATF